MLLKGTIDNIQVSNISRPKGDHSSIASGFLATFPPRIKPAELKDIYCENCPIFEYRKDTIGKPEGDERRGLIRCAGKIIKERILGPIQISNKLQIKELNSLFRYEDATPCGIYLETFRKILRSPLVSLPQRGVKIGDL